MRRYLLLSLVLLSGCMSQKATQDDMVSIQMIDRNGFSETISSKDRLSRYDNVDFLTPQPYQKVLRVFGRDAEGRSHSAATSYHPNGQVSQCLEIVDGRAHGTYREWHSNGKLKLEVIVIEGIADLSEMAQSSWLFDGRSVVWNENGQIIAEIFYDKGSLESTAIYYHPNGQVEKKVPFQKNEIDGEFLAFTNTGILQEKIPYKKGKKQGTAVGFWENERAKYVEEFEEGKLQEGYYYYPDGTSASVIKKGQGKQALFENAALHTLVEYKAGEPCGRVELYEPSGALRQEYHIHEGKKTGEEKEYYLTSTSKLLPKLSVMWHEDKIHGTVKTWYENGVMESQREVNANKKHGLSFAWYKDGSLMLSEEYENDILLKGSYFKKGNKNPVSKVESGKGYATLHDKDGLFLKKITYDKGKPILDTE